MKSKLFKKILIANRGEIAIRVMRACRELGIPTAAVYSDADRSAIHVRYADEAHHIGGAPATEAYLQLERIVKVAHDCGADPIHPARGIRFGTRGFTSKDTCVIHGPSGRSPSATPLDTLTAQATAGAGASAVIKRSW